MDTNSKDFIVSRDRNSEAIITFIAKLIPNGNKQVTDGWHGYDWVDRPNSGYTRYVHIHGHYDLGYFPESTSHIESIWAQLK